MIGMNRKTGEKLSAIDHIRQSISDILTTPIGTRIMRRAYGSFLFELIDVPFNAVTRQRMFAATIDALIKWEPRVIVKSIDITADMNGRVVIDLEGIVTETEQTFSSTTILGGVV
jgi:uncharacterized protein